MLNAYSGRMILAIRVATVKRKAQGFLSSNWFQLRCKGNMTQQSVSNYP